MSRGVMPSVLLAFLFVLFLIYITITLISGGQKSIAKGTETGQKLTGQEVMISEGSASFSCSENSGVYTATLTADLSLRYSHEGRLAIKPIAELYLNDKKIITMAAQPSAISYDSKALEEEEKSSLEGVKIKADFRISEPYDVRRSGKLTFWRDVSCVNIYLNENPIIDVNKLIERCPESYLGNFPFTESLSCGRILVVMTDPADSTEVWIYMLTGDLKYDAGDVEFNLDNYARTGAATPECIVAAVNENSGLTDHMGSVWYVQPGGIVKKTGNMLSGLAGNIRDFSCKKFQDDCDTSPRGDFVICGNAATCNSLYAGPNPSSSSEKSVGEAPYTTAEKDLHCSSTKCNLLEKKGDNWVWTPKYELLCTEEGVWKACYGKGYNGGIIIKAGGKNHKCSENEEWAVV